MIQRVQTVYLLIATICSVVCLSLPVGRFVSDGLLTSSMYNLWIVNADGSGRSFASAPLFVILLLSAALQIYTIFMYGNRKLQMRFCSFSTLLMVGWYIVYAVMAMLYGGDAAQFSPAISGALPAVSVILTIMARMAIRADERLVRAADRIR